MEPTKVFISWSGERSKALANALRTWLPDVLQTVTPWMSQHDIGAGKLWGSELDKELQDTFYGIVCITPENPNAPWLNYEVGALAKTLAEGAVVPYLLQMEPAELPNGPISRFQSKLANEDGTWDIVNALNASRGARAMQIDQLKRIFDKWWPDLQEKVANIPAPVLPAAARSIDDKVDEILETVRSLSREVITQVSATKIHDNVALSENPLRPENQLLFSLEEALLWFLNSIDVLRNAHVYINSVQRLKGDIRTTFAVSAPSHVPEFDFVITSVVSKVRHEPHIGETGQRIVSAILQKIENNRDKHS